MKVLHSVEPGRAESLAQGAEFMVRPDGKAAGYQAGYLGYGLPPGRTVAQPVLAGVAQLVKHER